MKSSDISLAPLSASKFESLLQREDLMSQSGEVPVLGTAFDNPTKTTAFAGYCDRFDLSTEKGRADYAELSAKLLPNTDVVRLWEERVHGPDGAIYVYVSYVKLLEVYQSRTDKL